MHLVSDSAIERLSDNLSVDNIIADCDPKAESYVTLRIKELTKTNPSVLHLDVKSEMISDFKSSMTSMNVSHCGNFNYTYTDRCYKLHKRYADRSIYEKAGACSYGKRRYDKNADKENAYVRGRLLRYNYNRLDIDLRKRYSLRCGKTGSENCGLCCL